MSYQRSKIKFIGVQPEEILYFQAIEGNVIMSLTDNTEIPCKKTLNELERQPSLQDFYRVNRSLLVNVKKISTIYTKDERTTVKMMNGYTADFSKSRLNQFIYKYAKAYFFL